MYELLESEVSVRDSFISNISKMENTWSLIYFDKDSIFKFIGSSLENFNFKVIHGINSAFEMSNSTI